MPWKVLIADDEPYIVHVLAIKLRNAGYEVFTAADGEEAVQACLAEEPDVIITDYQMPYLSGPELCREYRKRSGRTVPALLITAREFDVDPEHLEETGVEMVLAKPFSPRQVLDEIETMLMKNESKPSTLP
jgi:two-component system alkaline phosphatase synthesis response regulator PhoP